MFYSAALWPTLKLSCVSKNLCTVITSKLEDDINAILKTTLKQYWKCIWCCKLQIVLLEVSTYFLKWNGLNTLNIGHFKASHNWSLNVVFLLQSFLVLTVCQNVLNLVVSQFKKFYERFLYFRSFLLLLEFI